MSSRSKSRPIGSSAFSDFIRNASSSEKKRVYAEVMKKAAARQLAQLRAAFAEGLSSGPGKPASEVFDRLEAKYRHMAKKITIKNNALRKQLGLRHLPISSPIGGKKRLAALRSCVACNAQ